jgi:hypothetical protein
MIINWFYVIWGVPVLLCLISMFVDVHFQCKTDDTTEWQAKHGVECLLPFFLSMVPLVGIIAVMWSISLCIGSYRDAKENKKK